MKKIVINKKFILVALGLVTTLLIFLQLYLASNPPSPTIINTSPPNNATNIDLGASITITFDQSITDIPLTINATPENIFTINKTRDTIITLDHQQPLLPSTKYVIQILDGNELNYTLTFSTLLLNTDPRTLQQIHQTLQDDFPLADLTPYETNSLRVVYISPMTLEITLKNDSLTTSEAISQIKSWVSSNGGDPLTHKYQVISTP